MTVNLFLRWLATIETLPANSSLTERVTPEILRRFIAEPSPAPAVEARDGPGGHPAAPALSVRAENGRGPGRRR